MAVARTTDAMVAWQNYLWNAHKEPGRILDFLDAVYQVKAAEPVPTPPKTPVPAKADNAKRDASLCSRCRSRTVRETSVFRSNHPKTSWGTRARIKPMRRRPCRVVSLSVV